MLYSPGAVSSMKSSCIGALHACVLNSASTLFAGFLGVVCTRIILCNEKPLIIAFSAHKGSSSVGSTSDILPFSARISFDFLKNFSGDSESLWRARVRLLSLHFRLFAKYGGLLTTASNFSLGVNFV